MDNIDHNLATNDTKEFGMYKKLSEMLKAFNDDNGTNAVISIYSDGSGEICEPSRSEYSNANYAEFDNYDELVTALNTIVRKTVRYLD